MTLNNDVPIYYHCPRCQSFRVKEYERNVFCTICKLTFDKKYLRVMDDEDILANEELEGIVEMLFDVAEDFQDDEDDFGDFELTF